MPIYEYRCGDCARTSSVFVRSVSAAVEPACEACGSTSMTRMISKVARLKTDSDVHAEHGSGEGIRDPRQIGRWVEQRFEDYGMDVPTETRDAIERARSGDLPPEIADL